MSAQLVEREPTVYRDYSPEFKAEALATVKANNGNVLRTARELGIPQDTLYSWVSTYADRYFDLQNRKQLDLAAKHENNLHRLTDSVTDTDLNTVTFMQKVTAIGILTDKMLLLRGQPTSITEHVERQEVSVLLSSILNVEP